MQPSYDAIHQLLSLALQEDIGRGDITSVSILSPDMQMTAKLTAREEMRVAGLHIAALTFAMVDDTVKFTPMVADSETVPAGKVLAEVEGSAISILTAERTALNLLQRMCGVATLTSSYVKAVEGTGVEVLDTRKTMPGHRELDKYAVLCGGGRNHRLRLDDGLLIKDNHIAAAGGIAPALERAKFAAPALMKIEVECDTLAQVEEAATLGADVILLDNMTPTQLREAVKLIDGRAKTEASGGITLETIAEVAATGVNAISIGALTHSATAVDIGLDIDA